VDFWDVTKLLFRRWYIAVPLLLLTAAVSVFVAIVVKPDYQLTSYVQLIPSSTTSTPAQVAVDPVNPWNSLGLDALSQAVDYATVDQTFLDSLKAAGLTSDFTITIGTPAAGAMVMVVGPTREQVDQTTALVMARFDQNVKALQSSYGVRPQDMITTKRLDQGENLKQPTGKVKRAVVAVIGAGGLLTCATTIIVDVVLMRRRRRATLADTVRTTRVSFSVPAGDHPIPPPRRPLKTLAPADAGGGGAATTAGSDDHPRTPVGTDSTMVMPLPDLDEWIAEDNEGTRR
jgi:hypothetical protein